MSLQKKWAFYSFYLLAFVLPLEPIFSTVASLAFILLVLFSSGNDDFQRLIKWNKPYWVLLYFVLACVGLIYTDQAEIPLDRIFRQSPLLLFPLAIVLLDPKPADIQKALKYFIAGCFIFCILSILSLLYNFIVHYNLRFQYNFVQSSMYHFHFPYDTLYVNLAYVFLLFSDLRNIKKLLVGLIFFIVVFLFGVRTGIASFVLLTFIFIIINLKTMLTWKNAGVALMLGCFIVLLLKTSPYVRDKYFDSLNKLGLVKDNNISSIGSQYHKMDFRFALWESAWVVIKEKPFFGHGTNGGNEALREAYESRGLENRDEYNSHNQYLSTTLEYGLTGLAILLFIMGIFSVYAIRERNPVMLLFILVIYISFFTESYLIRQKGILLFAMFMALFFMSSNKSIINTNRRISEVT